MGILLALTRDPPAGRDGRSCCPAGCRGEPPTDHKRTHLLLAAGGTGGHMFPAQALAEAMLRAAGG
jgi:hypothetical protein